MIPAPRLPLSSTIAHATLLVGGTVLVCAPAAAGEPDDDAARRATVADAVAAIDALGTAWRVRDVIWDLDARYGTFGDLDGDGDLDYVATEMLHGPERLTTYLREDAGWRRVARFGKELQSRHPLLPWIVADGGNGHAAIVAPTGWAPYFVVYPTDGAGQPAGDAVSLRGVLPKRVSTPGGVDNVPYHIERVVPASAGTAAEIVGTIIDESDDGSRAVEQEWHVALRPDRPRLVRIAGLREPPLRIDDDSIPTAVKAPAGRGACEHASDLRRTPLLPQAEDVDGDGTLDLVVLGGDFAAHLFRGSRDATGRLTFSGEAHGTRPLPGRRHRDMLVLGAPTDDDVQRARHNAIQLEPELLPVHTPETALQLTTVHGLSNVVTYFLADDTLVPVFRERHAWPHAPGGAWERVTWRDIWHDVTGDGVPDALSAGSAHEIAFGGPEDGGRRVLHDGTERPAIVFWEGESGPDDARTVALFDVPVTTKGVHDGLPLSIEPVRIEGDEDADVYCIHLRPWNVGIFVEIDPSRAPGADESRRRRAAAWLARGDDAFDHASAYDTCDAGLCRRGLRLHDERVRDALFCYRRAAGLAADDETRVAAAVGAARCREALGLAERSEPPRTWADANDRAARRLTALARRAGRDDQEATERALLERALELSPDLSAARLRLGFRRAGGVWSREPERAVDVENRVDTSYEIADRHRARALRIELERADALLALATADGTLSPGERALLLDVLRTAPDHDGVHRALGHTWVGGGWARPELVRAAQHLAELEMQWRAIADEEVAVERAEGSDMPSVDAKLPVFTAGGTHVVLGLPYAKPERADAAGRRIAAGAVRARTFIEDVLGGALRPWRQRHVWITNRAGYLAAVRAHVADEARQRAQMNQSSLDLLDTLVLWCGSERLAHDLYAHLASFRTVYYGLARPDLGDTRAGFEAHAWFAEGLAFLTTLELFDSADTWIFSYTETSQKALASREPPTPRGRSTCLAYVRQGLMDGSAPRLSQLFSRTLNNLDLLSSLEAWAFLRFAAAYDPDGLARLPAELRAATEGSYAQRSTRAVERAFDRDLDELERLFRTFTLEVR